ncbi:MAG: hypothetical protein IJO68_06580 [Clostridia bacterium]|nr:hypothetical protein [Clostridia bacterium]
MDFEKITKIIDDIVAFIKRATANLKRFIAGFKTDLEFNAEDVEGIE